MSEIIDKLATMPHDTYLALKMACEIGKWPDGSTLTLEQKEYCLQAMIVYQANNLDQNEHLTVNAKGEFTKFTKDELIAQLKQ